MKESLLKIIGEYGVLPQLKYFQSEVFELGEAILEVEHSIEPSIQNKDHIAEELADVTVMLKQFQYYYGITDEVIEEVMKQKIERQLKRIDRGE